MLKAMLLSYAAAMLVALITAYSSATIASGKLAEAQALFTQVTETWRR